MPKKKKKTTKPERHEERLRKARQWALAYTGTHLIRDYRKRFKVDVTCALDDMKAIGALSPEKLETMKRAQGIRLQKKNEQRELEQEQRLYDRFPNSDNTFFYIAGYTPGGAPYGVTWEEIGLEPYESLDDTDE